MDRSLRARRLRSRLRRSFPLLVGALVVALVAPAGAWASGGPPAVTEFSDGIPQSTNGGIPPVVGITAGPDGNLWFTEPGDNMIGQITPAGVITKFPSGLQNGYMPGTYPPLVIRSLLGPSIILGPDGNLWINGYDGALQAPEVGRITATGVSTWFPVDGDLTAVGPEGNLWGSSPGGILRMTPAGAATTFSNGLAPGYRVGDLAAGPDGNLWFTAIQPRTGGMGLVGRITPAGVITEFRPRPHGLPLDIVAGADGNLWFNEGRSGLAPGEKPPLPSDIPAGAIARITPSGTITEFPLRPPATCPRGELSLCVPVHITRGADGDIWFTANTGIPPYSCRIGRITPAGQVTEFSSGIGFDTQCVGIATGSDGNIWFTEGVGHASPFGGRIGRLIPPPSPDLIAPGVVVWPTCWVAGAQAVLGTVANPPAEQVTVTLGTVGPPAHRDHGAPRGAVPPGRVTVQVGTGRSGLIKLSLARSVRSALRKSGALKVIVSVRARLASAGTRTAARSVVLRRA